jgi:hypothetical protein
VCCHAEIQRRTRRGRGSRARLIRAVRLPDRWAVIPSRQNMVSLINQHTPMTGPWASGPGGNQKRHLDKV